MNDPDEMRPIGSVYAYLSEGTDGSEGICGFLDGDAKTWIPMVCAKKDLALLLRPMVQSIARETSTTIRLVKFTTREDLETILP